MKISLLSVLLFFTSFNTLTASSHSLQTKIEALIVYPQPVVPGGVQYTELIITIPQDMIEKPSCAALANRFVIDSNNPMFPYVFGLLTQAQKDDKAVTINYWGQCEASGTHLAPLIRSIGVR